MYAGESVSALSAQLSASYTFKAPNHATLLHSAPALVVPVEVSEQAIALSYEATPALSPYAYLTGELTHADKRPLLAGPASLFSAGAFVGETQLSSALKGDKLTLFLGADPDLRLDRRVEVESHTKGLIGAREISVYTTKIQVANDKRRAVKLKLYDVLPLSQHDEVEVSLKQLTPKAQVDKETGVVCWELELKAGARADLTFIYQVSRPKGWRVSQR